MSVRIETVSGKAIARYLYAVAELRIAVFREYPYLYDGSPEYEARYLDTYADSPDGRVVLALDGDDVIGASTAMPLRQHSDDVVPPLQAAGFDPDTVYYFGESVLRPAYRGQGIGRAFFDEREAAARELGYTVATFCAVQRPDDHPQRPPDYHPLDAFWTRRGYIRRDDIVAHFAWKEIGEREQSEKPMVFWTRELGA